MLVQYPAIPSSFSVSTYGSWQSANAGLGPVIGRYWWLGIYDNGSQFEFNQLMLGFDLSAKPDRPVESVTLELPISETFGFNRVVVVRREWQDGVAASFVKGSEIAGLQNLAEFTVEEGEIGSTYVTIPASAITTGVLKIALLSKDQTLDGYAGSGDDTSLVVSAGVKLHVTYGEASASATAEGSITLNAASSAQTVATSTTSASFMFEALSAAQTVASASAMIELALEGGLEAQTPVSGSLVANITFDAVAASQAVSTAITDASISLNGSLMASPVLVVGAVASIGFSVRATARLAGLTYLDPLNVVKVPRQSSVVSVDKQSAVVNVERNSVVAS